MFMTFYRKQKYNIINKMVDDDQEKALIIDMKDDKKSKKEKVVYKF